MQRRNGTALTPPERATLRLAVLQLVCAVVFAVDLLLEFPHPHEWLILDVTDTTHLFTEVAVMALLVLGFALSRYALRAMQAERDVLRSDLRSLRGEFDAVLQARFALWHLSPAQRDVALLTLRGLRIADIARMRACAEGTVKAHLSAVFRAAGVGTRNELQGLFMEEFLDFGAVTEGRA